MADELSRRRDKRPSSALEEVTAAHAAAVTAGREVRRAIVRASKAGAKPTAIAKAAGLTRARIYQILKEEERTS